MQAAVYQSHRSDKRRQECSPSAPSPHVAAFSQGLNTVKDCVPSPTYTESPFSKLAVEGHLDFVFVSSPLVKGVAAVEGWAVQMQADGRLCVAYVLHTVQANGVYTKEGMKQEVALTGRFNEISDTWKKCHPNLNS